MKCAVEMASSGMMYVPSFMNIGTGDQAVLKSCLRNFTGFNVGIADGRIYELRRSDGLRCHDIHAKFNEDWCSHSNVNRGDTHTDRKTAR
jgi:hypothetical protein